LTFDLRCFIIGYEIGAGLRRRRKNGQPI
jgi:hypothetical protein